MAKKAGKPKVAVTRQPKKAKGKKEEKVAAQKVGAVMVVGAGVAGMQAALDLADTGYYVYLVERQTAIGGVMPQLDKTFPTNDCSICIISPKLADVGRHLNIEIMAPAQVTSISGEPGNFSVKVTQPARYIDMAKCTACGLCAEKCPKKVPNKFNAGLDTRKSAYVLYPQAVPLKYAIDKETCIYFQKGGKCKACEKFCTAEAVNFEEPDVERNLEVGAVILAPGFEVFDARQKPEYGYGRYPNVVTALEFERFLSATGPYAGHIVRPSDHKEPEKIAWIQCVGSRDASIGRDYCSYACCMYATKQAIIAGEHDAKIKPTIFYIDLRAQGKGFDRYCERAKETHGVRFVRSMISRVVEDPLTHNLEITYQDEQGVLQTEIFDLVVLSVGFKPHGDIEQLAKTMGVDLNTWGFVENRPLELISTNRDGIYACGVFQSPKDIPETVGQASAAAAAASKLLAEVRGTLAKIKEYPVERDVTKEEPRIGVFVCHCGINIASVIGVKSVAEYAGTLPHVVYADDTTFICSTDALVKVRQVIEEHKLNRVVVASCSPRTHEPLFQDTMRQAGLNKYLFKMANIRDQDSWVHQGEPEKATEKAKDLVRMSVARVAQQAPLFEFPIQVQHKALVVGGGLAGMTAALALADAGYDTYLVEKEARLGGLGHRVYRTLEGDEMQPYLADLIRKVENHPGIIVFRNTKATSFTGHIGKFKSTLEGPEGKQEVEYGAAVIATGGEEYKPTEYLYGENPKVLTQLEFEDLLVNRPQTLPAEPWVAMIQCVGCREPEHQYCSRICCSEAVKNALTLKELNPKARVFVLYRDIRTFGFKELYYKKARDLGVQFLRYDIGQKPVVSAKGDRLEIKVLDQNLQAPLTLPADYLVLSAAIRPHPDSKQVSQLFKLPLDADGFFMEAHLKLRPLDFASGGLFLCGLAHSPKFADETIAQAQGAASRALTVLTQQEMWVGGAVAQVIKDRCAECLTCVRTCPFEVPVIDSKAHVAFIDPAKCQGCGICASECPHKAIQIMHNRDEQLLAEINAIEVPFEEERVAAS
jgi:heterodisulfide reductase subunit A